jgi:hypothetical protein
MNCEFCHWAQQNDLEERTSTVQGINDEIRRYEKAIAELREKMKTIVDSRMKLAMDNAIHNQNVKVISEHPRMVLVKFSQLVGNPWSVQFHDWKAGGDLLIKWFEYKKLAPEKWYDTLKTLYDKRKEANRVDLPIREQYWPGYYRTITEPISAEFVKIVLDEMEKM